MLKAKSAENANYRIQLKTNRESNKFSRADKFAKTNKQKEPTIKLQVSLILCFLSSRGEDNYVSFYLSADSGFWGTTA